MSDEVIISTKDRPGSYDAIETAKPDERPRRAARMSWRALSIRQPWAFSIVPPGLKP